MVVTNGPSQLRIFTYTTTLLKDMNMMRIVVISGGLGSPSSTRVLGDDIVTRLREALALEGEELDAHVVELRELAHPIVDAMLTGFPVGDLARVVEDVASADALVAGAPVPAGPDELVALIDSGGTAGGVIEVLLSSTGGPVDDIPGHMRTTFELLPKLAGLNQKDRRRYASLAREWIEEAELQLRRRSDGRPGPTLGAGT